MANWLPILFTRTITLPGTLPMNCWKKTELHPLSFTPMFLQTDTASQMLAITIHQETYRAITRSDDIEAWWSFNRDSLRSNQVQSDSADRTTATIYDAWVTPREDLARALP